VRHVVAGLGLWLIAIVITGVAMLAFVDIDDATSLSAGAIAISIIPNAVVFIGWPLWVARRHGPPGARDTLGLRIAPKDVALAIAGALACLFGAALIEAGLSAVFPALESESNIPFDPDTQFSTLEMVILFLAIAVVTPIAEEIFFRGLVIPALRRRLGVTLTIVASSLLFTLPHLAAGLDPAALPTLAAIIGWWGIVLGAQRFLTEGRIAAPMITHALLNGTSLFVALDPLDVIDLEALGAAALALLI